MFLLAQAQQLSAQQRPTTEVKWAPGCLVRKSEHLSCLPTLHECLQIHHLYLYLHIGRDHLHRSSCTSNKRGTQALVTLYYLLQTLLEDPYIQHSLHAHSSEKSVGRTIYLFEEP